MEGQAQKPSEFIDPVCKMTVSDKPDAIKSQYSGKTYFFCSDGCKIEFEKDPKKYLG
jgi:YHS domain-containing protein